MIARRTLAMLAVLLSAALAHADPERPWAAGVSEADQTAATDLLARGNDLLDQGAFPQALELYRQAMAHWDHPAIRYNLAVALIMLERQIPAYEELQHALRYGEQALEPDVYRQALAYQRLLHAQIVELTIACPIGGTQITLDGKVLDKPCAATRFILPGRHELVASKLGYVPHAIEIAPSGGDAPHIALELRTIEAATVWRRHWASWKPLAVLGAGAAVALIGLGFELQAAATFRSYDHAVAVLCPTHPCATLSGRITDAYDEARRDNRVAIGLFAAGGATIATGAVLLWFNRAIATQLRYETAPVVSIHVGATQATIAAQLAF